MHLHRAGTRITPLAFLLLIALSSGVQAQTKVNIDVDLRHDEPRMTEFRRVRRFGWHSGLHYGPYVDSRGVWRAGWHRGTHQDWYTIDVPVLSKVNDADWEVFVNFGRDKKLRIHGDADRAERETTVVAPAGPLLGWLTPDGNVIAGGPSTPFRKRFVGNGWNGFDLGDSIIMMDLPASQGVEVYLKQRSKDIDTGPRTAPPKDPAKVLEERRARVERDRLLDEADQKFVLGLYPQAAVLYQKAMKADESDPIARFAVARCLFELGLFRTAGQNVRVGLDQFPDWGLVRLDLAKFYKDEAAFFNRLVELKRYVAEHPDDSDARLLLAYCQYFSGNRKEGLAGFDALMKAPGGDKHAELFVKLNEYEAYVASQSQPK